MEKGPKQWSEAMSGEGGIASIQEKFLSDISVTQLEESLSRDPFCVVNLRDSLEYHVVDKGYRQFPISGLSGPTTVTYQMLPSSNRYNPKLITAITENDTFETQRQLANLLITARMLVDVGTTIVGDYNERLFLRGELDMNSPVAVVFDNLSTLVNVFRVATQGIDVPDRLVAVMEQLISGDNSNHTQLEQCARAPFGFWALVMKVVPDEYNGEPVAGPNGFSNDFLDALRKEKVLTTIEPNTRHGGCPALYPAFRGLDHINRMGELFISWHKRLHTTK